MRTIALCALLGLAGCVKPDAPESPPPVADVPLRAVAIPEPLPQVPQDEYNLGQLERTRKSRDPLHRDLANGRFRGSTLDDLVAAYPPDLLLQHGSYTTAVYADGNPRQSMSHLYAISRNGRLVRAFGTSCVWHPVFFDGLTDEERQKWGEGYQAAFRAHYGLPLLPAPDDGTIPPPREVGKPAP